MNMDEKEQLLLKIANCEIIETILNKTDNENPCFKIVRSQKITNVNDFCLPEPWSGHIRKAPILFLGSNPFISKRDDQGNRIEEFPNFTWNDEDIIDFFENRFGRGKKEWVKDGKYTLRADGKHKKEAVKYWTSAIKWTAGLLGRTNVSPGTHFAITEVVHCKSREAQINS